MHAGELTALDMTINSYIETAGEYHREKLLKFSDVKKQKSHTDLLVKRKAYLEQQRLSIESMASVQEQLAHYQNQCRDTSQENRAKMRQEEHHPTKDLERYMRVSGIPKPDEHCTCHHIIMGHGRSKKSQKTGKRVQSAAAISARLKLHQVGIGINDPSNGVWLPKNMNHVPHWLMPKALPHSVIHTDTYEVWMRNIMQTVTSEATGRSALKRVGIMLRDGTRTHILTKHSETRYLQRVV